MRLYQSPKTILVAIFIAFIAAITLSAATPTASAGFHIESRWDIGGKGGWSSLSLDPAKHLLFIPRTNHVSVVNTDTGKLLGEVDGMSNIRNMALDDSGKYGYVTDVTDGSAGFVRVFDRSSLKLVASIPTDPIPYAIVFDRATKLVFAFSSRGHSAAVIDTAKNQNIATIALEGRPDAAAGDGRGSIFVTLPAQGKIQRIDAVSKKITASWQLGSCTGPSGLAIDTLHRQLFTTCENHTLVAINADTGHVVVIDNVLGIAGDLDFDSRSNMLFLASPAGLLAVYHRDSATRYTRLQDVKTEPGARTMVVDPDSRNVYLATAKFGLNSATVSEELRYRPTPIPNTFFVIVAGW